MKRFIFAVAGFCFALQGQQGHIGGPNSGFIFDETTHSVREIVGVPGASYFGNAIAAGVENAAVSPDGKALLAVRDGKLLGIANGVEVSLGSSVATLNWNQTSTAAAFVQNGHVILWNRSETKDLGTVDGAVNALILDAAGSNVFVSVANQGVLRFAENSPGTLLASVNDPVSLNFSGKEQSLLVVDRATHQVLEVSFGGGATRLAPEAVDPVAINASADGRNVFVVDGESDALLIYEGGALRTHIELGFDANRMDRLGSSDVFALNRRANGEALQVLALKPEPNVYFIPAPVED